MRRPARPATWVLEQADLLTTWERALLDELCRSRITVSSIALANDLVGRRALQSVGDPYGLVAWMLYQLNVRDLVVYREGYRGVPVEIRATPAGYAVAGYPYALREVGRYQRRFSPDDASRHPGDPTDFRNIGNQTWGGTVERLPLREHMTLYPEHDALHLSQLAELRQKGENDVARPSKWTPEIETRAVMLRSTGATYKTIAETLSQNGVSITDESIRQHLSGREQQAVTHDVATSIVMEPIVASSRDAILRVLDEHDGPGLLDSVEIERRLRVQHHDRWNDLHTVQTLLGQMRRRGLVSYVEHQVGRVHQMRQIELTDSGRRHLHRDVPSSVPQAVAEPEQESPVPPVDLQTDLRTIEGKDRLAAYEAQTAKQFPILDRLRARQRRMDEAVGLAERIRQAAELVRDDDAAYDLLIGRASEIETIETLTDVEIEYLDYASADYHEQ